MEKDRHVTKNKAEMVQMLSFWEFQPSYHSRVAEKDSRSCGEIQLHNKAYSQQALWEVLVSWEDILQDWSTGTLELGLELEKKMQRIGAAIEVQEN